MNPRRQFLLSSAVLAVTAGLPLSALAQEPAKLGFVYVSPIGDAGWTFQHDEGRKEMEKALGGKVHSRYVESVAEGADAERVIREFAASGSRIVFATSFGYMNYVERVARQFPNVTFVHATGYKSGKNFANYNARFYEGRYINGVIAGKMSKSNVLGYVGAFPIPEVLQGINAFTLGARSVNPNAEVRVIWINSWYDPGKEREAAMTLISQGADMLTHHTDSTATVQAAEEKGVHAFSYHSDMSKYGPRAQLSGTTHHWGDFYTRTVNEVLAGTWKPAGIWGGFREGMIRLAPFNAAVPAEVQAMAKDLEARMTAGSLHPFTGPLLDQAGRERLARAMVMDDATLGKMDYFVQGVSSRLPNAR
ncbi:BMP family ABC transporter substrate-binding protein [Thauera linaloolentis]|uniref:Basic membrane lipoprotein n=1 Tax=Thauera linaloolentis (strain DSM 12138 / JCM 21573 / CCUG 41526 / CIP 105981 / IAM 15112 / NBRC 102519 / 47Lol) TaxID=1123367 RepID=N6Z2D8_THAL4|nr:BMP family ABC transporter substrate-binding protein [Thauera linaloolentis]ENO88528.1 basic membrane lipoprotein [Thauera linaloolentis 47Lol = DSM 12138]MCM8564895.1 BMP family ABC transporter substrate-binding protein [Thauera linaloolentis]